MDALAYSRGVVRSLTKNFRRSTGAKQELDIYYDEKFAQALESWGVGNAWSEVQFLLGNRSGKVLDLACGTGRVHDFISRFPELEYHGCDISSLLIEKAVSRGIPADRVSVQDASKLNYADGEFDYVYSIGSLEHFTVDGLISTLSECNRVCRGINFHQFPVSRSGLNEGWLSTDIQSYWNNSEAWWLEFFNNAFGPNVWVLRSHWGSPMSRGVWMVSVRKEWLK